MSWAQEAAFLLRLVLAHLNLVVVEKLQPLDQTVVAEEAEVSSLVDWLQV